MATASVVPDAQFVSRIHRRTFKPVPIDVDDITSLIGVIREGIPWQRVILLTNAEKAAKTENRVFGMARNLVEHDIVDAA